MEPAATLNCAAAHAAAGRIAEAEAALRTALRHAPDESAFLQSLALLRQRQGDAAEAEALLRRAVALKPDAADCRLNLGNVLAAKGNHAGAADCFRQAIALRPGLAAAHGNLGNALLCLGRAEEAVAAQRQAVVLAPDNPRHHFGCAMALQALDRLDEAAAAGRRAVALAPDFRDAHLNLGVVLERLNRRAEAGACYRRALEIDPNEARALTNLGNVALAERRAEEALDLHRRALAVAPGLAEAQVNLGAALLALDRAEEAAAAAQRALALRPDVPDARKNLGVALERLGRHDAALAAFDQAIADDPALAEAHVARAMALLRAGDFARGWAEYAWRWRTREALAATRDFDRPLWRGEDIAGRTILLHAEQGLGDTIQFARYAPGVAQRGARVVFEVQPALVRLMAGLSGVTRVVGTGAALPPFDLHCPLLDLPGIFGTDAASIPAFCPYVSLDADAERQWRAKLDSRKGFKVGLVWAGNPDFPDDRIRSVAPRILEPLLAVERVAFHSLQIGDNARAIADVIGGDAVVASSDDFRDFADTAACIAALDLVIAVDTAVAHLAGAVAKPAWIMLPYVADWRWQMDRPDSPWYPTIRLYRQHRPGDWAGVVRRIAADLSANALRENR